MRKIFAYAAALAAVLLSAPAMAQSYGGFGQTVQAAGQGLAQGVIAQVDYQAGIVTIQQAGNRIQLHGTPGQIGTLKAGEAVVLPFNNYAGRLWLAPGFGSGGVAASGFGLQQVIAANVLEINKAQGLLRVAGPYGQMTLSAHPEDIDAVIPGQYVSLSYVDVGNRPWLTGVQLFSQGGFQSSGTMGAGGMSGNVGIGSGGDQFGMQGQQQGDQGLWGQQGAGGTMQQQPAQPQQPQQPQTTPPQSD